MDEQVFILKIFFSEHNVRKYKSAAKPETLTDLIRHIKIQLNIDYNFVLHYKDKDLQSFVTATSIEDIENLDTVKVMKIVEDEGSCTNEEANKVENKEETKPWPKVFSLPEFNEEVKAFLNTDFQTVTPPIRRKIVSSMANEVIKFTTYPKHTDIRNMCISLVTKYPKLQDNCPGGFDNWVISLKFKIGNLRKLLKDLPEVKINTGKKSSTNPNSPPPHTAIKKPRRGIVNKALSRLPIDENEETLRELQNQLQEEMKKIEPSSQLVSYLFLVYLIQRIINMLCLNILLLSVN